ncbi:MAG: sulfotransferase [Acidimicrobiia bacterium]|nr:sulfotransferase [Acidimicrobiia bacterium]
MAAGATGPGKMEPMRHAFVCGYSRSGTTLLATILDSHPRISMGYELVPSGLPALPAAAALLRRALAEDPADPAAVLRRDPATAELGLFVIHSGWALVGPEEVADLLEAEAAAGRADATGTRKAARLAMVVVERKREREGTGLTGFKVQTSRFGIFHRTFPDSAFLCIVRDPRDVVASQLGRGFKRSVERMATHWRDYYERFTRFARFHPSRTLTVRYEDLVADPEPQYARIFGLLGLEYGDEVRRYWDSKASVHNTRHNNAPAVGREPFTSSLGRWREDLQPADLATVERVCRRAMARFGYPPA